MSKRRKIWTDVSSDGKDKSFGTDEDLTIKLFVGTGSDNSNLVGKIRVTATRGVDVISYTVSLGNKDQYYHYNMKTKEFVKEKGGKYADRT